ncbi:MAG: hypothetical protein IJ048_01200 [Clostridia bacterium]|nr:hypothetical protein [Clostridia bacterium]
MGKKLLAAVLALLYEYLEPRFAARDYDGGARDLFDALLVRVAAYEGLSRAWQGIWRAFSGLAC